MKRTTRIDSGFRRHLTAVGTTFCLLALLSGCPGVSSTNGNNNGTDPDTPGPTSLDVSGRWSVSGIDSSSCGGSGSSETNTWDVTQNGSNVTVTAVDSSFALSGTIAASTLSLQGSFPQDGGTTTVTNATISITPGANTFSGSNAWTWTDGSSSCSGTTILNGSRS